MSSHSLHENTPCVILVHPQMGENIGMVARAMLNCGLTDLRLVAPRDGWPNPAAQSASSGALDKGVEVSLFESTADAIADTHFVLATTARPRDMIKTVYTPHIAINEALVKVQTGQKTAILFGGERAGLHNDDIALSNAIITVPLNPDFTSLNLAQAVLLIGYEYYTQSHQAEISSAEFVTGNTNIAAKDSINNLIQRLEEQLEEHHFFRSADMRPTTMRNLQNLFSRMQITDQEINTFHGIISALLNKKSPIKHE